MARGSADSSPEVTGSYADAGSRMAFTVEVMSAEQESQTYLTPPSPPLAATFFLMTPIFRTRDRKPARLLTVAAQRRRWILTVD